MAVTKTNNQLIQKAQGAHHQNQEPCMTTRRRSLVLVLNAVSLFSTLVLVSLASSQIPTGDALACYETVNGKTTIIQNESWVYCALSPALGHGHVNGTQFGLGPENDLLSAYNSAFGMSADEYRILTVCIYERYDFGRFMTLRPDSSMVEFVFRCVCNYDLCNSETNFGHYLSAIKSESFAKR